MQHDSTECEHVQDFWGFMAERAEARAAVEERAAGGPRQGSRGPAPYLEQNGKTVTGPGGIEVRACGCRSRFCPHCCLPLGLALKQKLKPELAKFTGLMMLTFTIDPELFASPEEAYAFVTGKRCIAVTVQRLHRWGLLQSRRFVCVVEWQKDSEQAHWHVLVDASFIPFDKLCEAWNRNWKGWRERVAAGRPGLGSVRFSVPKFKSVDKAIGYVTAYLTKHPPQGFPDWVLDSKRQIHRFTTSRGFWTEQAAERQERHDQDEHADAGHEHEDQADQEQPRKARTIREKLATCRTCCSVFLLGERLDQDTGEMMTTRRFVMRLPVPIEAVLELGPVEVNKRKTVAVFADTRPLRPLMPGAERESMVA